MHIELTELMRCPKGHDEAFLVLATAVMKGRHVQGGILGCPVCRVEVPVVKGVAMFSRESGNSGKPGKVPSADALQALLGLSNAGGTIAMVGSAGGVANELASLLGGTHVICIDAPEGMSHSDQVSHVVWDSGIPLKKNSARGVVIGSEMAREPWLSEAGRIVLKGLRVVVLGGAAKVEGLQTMAQSPDAWVGQKV